MQESLVTVRALVAAASLELELPAANPRIPLAPQLTPSLPTRSARPTLMASQNSKTPKLLLQFVRPPSPQLLCPPPAYEIPSVCFAVTSAWGCRESVGGSNETCVKSCCSTARLPHSLLLTRYSTGSKYRTPLHIGRGPTVLKYVPSRPSSSDKKTKYLGPLWYTLALGGPVYSSVSELVLSLFSSP